MIFSVRNYYISVVIEESPPPPPIEKVEMPKKPAKKKKKSAVVLETQITMPTPEPKPIPKYVETNLYLSYLICAVTAK